MKKISLFLLGIQIFVIFVFWNYLPPELPLFYSRPWGEEQLTKPAGLFFLPFTSFLVICINSLLIKFIAKEEKLISETLNIASVVFNFLCLITLVQIIRIII